MTYVTFNAQKDGRYTLGTALHLFKDCPSLKNRIIKEISGEIIKNIPKCHHCFTRKTDLCRKPTILSPAI